MRKSKRFHSVLSLKNQLLLYFILIALTPTCIIGIYYYNSSKSVLYKNIGENSFKVISHIMDNIEKQVEQANNITDWIYADTTIAALLKRSPSEIVHYDLEKKRGVENIGRLFQYSPVTQYLQSMLLIGNNNLDIRYGPDAAFINTDDILWSEWFEKENKNNSIFWGSIVNNYTDITKHPQVIPQLRMIKDLENGWPRGYVVMLFNQAIFGDCYKEVLLNRGEKIYLADAAGNLISSNQAVSAHRNIRDKPYFQAILQDAKGPYFETEIDRNIYMVTYKKSPKTGWVLMEIVPTIQIQEQKRDIEKTTVILVLAVISMCIFLSVFLSENFTRPIKRLVKQVNEIAQGNFDRSVQVVGRNEISELGNSIIKMQTDIKNLIRESIQKEKEKRILEIRMLQSQINPHFLYNTLHTIKWMARLQGAKGIENMTGSLGRILKAALSGLNEKILLQQEISILEDYVYIQKIRYKGKMQFHKQIADERLLYCKVIKFILQPILENTILHGIEPKEETGAVLLSVFVREGRLIMEVWDDGVGMSEEKMEMLRQSCRSLALTQATRGIGLNNINQRIKLVYGEEYGLCFDSKEGEYTRVTIELPVEMQ